MSLSRAIRDLAALGLYPSKALKTIAPTLVAQAYTTQASDLGSLLSVSPAASNATITLLSAVTAGDGAVQYIRKADAAAGRVIVSDGADQAWLSAQGDIVAFQSNGSSWRAIGWNVKPLKQVFTSSGTWTKAPLAARAKVIAFGQGGGGSSGQRRATSNIRTGGGAGGPGAVVQMELLASILGPTETVTIPTDATGGAAVQTNDTVGTIGTQGSATTFGPWLKAVAGAPGGPTAIGGSAPALGTGQSGGISQLTQCNLGIPNAGPTSATTGSTPTPALAGQVGVGGPGAGAVVANTIAPACAGANGSCYSGTPTLGGGVGSSLNPGADGADITDTDTQMGGGGGGGGFWATGVVGTAGGKGGAPGGGGGGGGASDNGSNSGAGGTPGRGEVRVTTYFD